MITPELCDDSFIADVMADRHEHSNALRLWWLGQSGFLLQYRGRHLLFDPYLSDSLTTKYANTRTPHVRISQRVIAPERLDFVDVVTSTHIHTDHLDAATLIPITRAYAAARGAFMAPDLVLPAASIDQARARLSEVDLPLEGMCAFERETIRGFEFTAVPAAHPDLAMDEKGRNRYLGYVVKIGATTVYHSGDTVVFDGMVEELRPSNIAIALLPINGKLGNMNGIDAARLARDIGAKLVVPCHYDMFEFNTADPYEQFVPECERIGQPYRVLKLGERLTLPEKSK